MMVIAPPILELFPNLNKQQKEAVSHTDGALVIIAGPGSGKTLVLILRAINIIIRGIAQPRELILCTFTEKAAFELRDRINSTAKKCGYNENLSEK